MFADIMQFLKSLSFIDYVFFFTLIFLIILVVSLIYFIKINGKTSEEVTDSNDLKEIALALEKSKPISFTPFEKEEEEKAIISYDELLSNTGEYELNYSDEQTNGDISIKKVDLNNLINVKKVEPTKIDVKLMSLSHEEEFLKTLKELQKILN